MNILIVGGSNSVMKHGYSDQLADLLDRPDMITLTGSKAQITNLSVGANSAMRGLETLKGADLDGIDLLILEYFINDLPVFSRDGAEFWLACYEGMIRYALSMNPRLRIMPLMLGRRDKQFYAIQNGMRDGMTGLAEKYDLKRVDFDQFAHPYFLPRSHGESSVAKGAAKMIRLIHNQERMVRRPIPHGVLMTRTSAAFASRALRNVREQLREAGITVFGVPIVERAAYRDIFDYGGLLRDLPRAQVSNLEKACQNANAFMGEILTTLRKAKQASETKNKGAA